MSSQVNTTSGTTISGKIFSEAEDSEGGDDY